MIVSWVFKMVRNEIEFWRSTQKEIRARGFVCCQGKPLGECKEPCDMRKTELHGH